MQLGHENRTTQLSAYSLSITAVHTAAAKQNMTEEMRDDSDIHYTRGVKHTALRARTGLQGGSIRPAG